MAERAGQQTGVEFVGLGLAKGDRVGLILGNEPRGLVSLFGPLRAGMALVPMNPKLHPSEHAYMLGHCGARALVVSRPYLEGLLAMRAVAPGRAAVDRHRRTRPSRSGRPRFRSPARGGRGPAGRRGRRCRRSRLDLLHLRHDRAAQGRHAEPSQSDDDGQHAADRIQSRAGDGSARLPRAAIAFQWADGLSARRPGRGSRVSALHGISHAALLRAGPAPPGDHGVHGADHDPDDARRSRSRGVRHLIAAHDHVRRCPDVRRPAPGGGQGLRQDLRARLRAGRGPDGLHLPVEGRARYRGRSRGASSGVGGPGMPAGRGADRRRSRPPASRGKRRRDRRSR